MKDEKIIFLLRRKENSHYERPCESLTHMVGGHLDMGTLLEKFKQFCLAVGYHPDCVKKIQILEEEELDELGYGD